MSEDLDQRRELCLQGLKVGAVQVTVDRDVLCDVCGSLHEEGRVGGGLCEGRRRYHQGFLYLQAVLDQGAPVDGQFGCEGEDLDVG